MSLLVFLEHCVPTISSSFQYDLLTLTPFYRHTFAPSGVIASSNNIVRRMNVYRIQSLIWCGICVLNSQWQHKTMSQNSVISSWWWDVCISADITMGMPHLKQWLTVLTKMEKYHFRVLISWRLQDISSTGNAQRIYKLIDCMIWCDKLDSCDNWAVPMPFFVCSSTPPHLSPYFTWVY